MSEWTLERLTGAHLCEVASLEVRCFAEPWSEHALELLLGDNAFGFACVACGRVIAYGGMLVAVDEGQVTNIVTAPEARRLGCGLALMQALEEEARARGLCRLSLEVRVSNTPAIALYERAGYTAAGRRRAFYRHPTEDAWVMLKEL